MLSFMDVHHTRLFPQPKKPSSFLGSVANALFSDKEAAEREAAELAMSVETLRSISWCPVRPVPFASEQVSRRTKVNIWMETADPLREPSTRSTLGTGRSMVPSISSLLL